MYIYWLMILNKHPVLAPLQKRFSILLSRRCPIRPTHMKFKHDTVFPTTVYLYIARTYAYIDVRMSGHRTLIFHL